MSIGIVQTKFGNVSGVESPESEQAGITLFKDIPYAAPPVGPLRWKAPQDPTAWDGIRNCNKYGARPMQLTPTGLSFEPWETDFYYMGNPEMSEDCLYLSVATGAANANEKRPVFIWFHGGGLSSGFYHEIEFNPYELAKKGIVVISVGQRLNIFGYLTLPQLSSEQGGKSGNYGLMDEVKALDWIYENIEAFGGDPENITVGGQSGGTSKSGALATTPANKGHIKRVINQSPLHWIWNRYHRTVAEVEKSGQEYLKSVGIDPGMSLDELRKMEPEKFYAAGGRIPGELVFDGYYVPEQDLAVSFEKYASNLDYLTGANYGETCMRPGILLGGEKFESSEDVYKIARQMLGKDIYDKYDFERIAGVTNENADHRSRRIASLGLNTLSGIMVSRYFGAYRSEKFPDAKTYTYMFSHPTPSLPQEKGTYRDQDNLLAWHSSELWYTFASLRKGIPPARPWTEEDFKLADMVSSYWANFIKTGNPNGEELPYWPICSENMAWMDLDIEPTAHVGLENKLDEMLYEHVLKNVKDLPK